MALTAEPAFNDVDYAVAPGETLRETLEALGMSQRELADRTGLSEKTVSQIINGVAPLTHDTAIKLERVTGVPARMWNNLESLYREELARMKQDEHLAGLTDWVDELPLKDLRDAGIITTRKSDRVGVLQEFLGFFGVVDRETYDAVWGQPAVAFRQSAKHEPNPVAVAAWLRQGELDAVSVECEPFDEEAFTDTLRLARATMTEDPSDWYAELREEFSRAGVALVLRSEVRGARAFGATRWLTPHKAVIQLSLRRRWEDEFWFSLFHEACHVLRHSKKGTFVSDGNPDNKYENEANQFAAQFLIPRRYETELLSIRTLSEVPDFAEKVGVPPGVVVGRLQREKVFTYAVGNKLRRRFKLAQA